MHELSICQALLTQVGEIARGRGAEAIERVTIELGPLSGVEPGLLLNAFTVMRARGIAADAELLIEAIDVTVSCLTCGEVTGAAANRLLCGRCGGFRTRLVAGDELRLRRIEMRMPATLAAAPG